MKTVNAQANHRYMQIKGTRRIVLRPCLTKQLVRRVDIGVTAVQEWLEGEDKLASKVVGYGVVVLAGIFMLGQVMRCLNG